MCDEYQIIYIGCGKRRRAVKGSCIGVDRATGEVLTCKTSEMDGINEKRRQDEYMRAFGYVRKKETTI